MTNDMMDRLLTWISKQEEIARRDMVLTSDVEFNRGRYSALLDVKVFIMTNGRLQEPSVQVKKD